MSRKEYLNEVQYQKTKKKLNIIGTILLCVGIPLAICSIVLQVLLFSNVMLIGLSGASGLIMSMLGINLKLISKGREINAFYAQQQMPVNKESIEKMAPSVGVAAKEITKGIKEGLDEEE